MLDEIPHRKSRRVVFRLSRISANDDEFLAELGLDPEARKELLNLLSGRIPQDPIADLLDAPFRPRTKLRRKTRFSDGTFPVFYSALAMETAQAEMAYWFGQSYAGKPKRNRTAYYQSFRCAFEGSEKDLRSKVADWPGLIHGSDYSLCNRLGAEARDEGIDGLVVPSARHQGVNMPVFFRKAVSGPELEEVVTISYNPDTGQASVNRMPQEADDTDAQR